MTLEIENSQDELPQGAVFAAREAKIVSHMGWRRVRAKVRPSASGNSPLLLLADDEPRIILLESDCGHEKGHFRIYFFQEGLFDLSNFLVPRLPVPRVTAMREQNFNDISLSKLNGRFNGLFINLGAI